jgi:hypothetical protein
MTREHCGQAKKHLDYALRPTRLRVRNRPESEESARKRPGAQGYLEASSAKPKGAYEADTDNRNLSADELERSVRLLGKGMLHRLIARHDFSGDGGVRYGSGQHRGGSAGTGLLRISLFR